PADRRTQSDGSRNRASRPARSAGQSAAQTPDRPRDGRRTGPPAPRRAGEAPGGRPASGQRDRSLPAPGWRGRAPGKCETSRPPASVLLPELLGDRNRHLGHFEQFVGRDRRLAPFLDGTQEGRSAIVLPLILSPGALPAEPGPVESLQREEVVELQRAPGREHLDP